MNKPEPIQDLKIKPTTTIKQLVQQLNNAGFQSQNIGEATKILKEATKKKSKTFLSFTSNMAASGIRGIIIDLIKKKQITAIITSSGTIDEDLIRSKLTYLKGDFNLNDEELGKKGINRMGNILVPNNRYQYLDQEIQKHLKKIYKQQKKHTASELIQKIGENWKHTNSIIKQAAKNKIPIYCPAITDGSFGMQITFFKKKHPDFEVDTLKDFQKLIDQANNTTPKTGIILGGGTPKHHTIISALLSEGFDYTIYINSNSPHHGSLSNATTQEAKSWGKIKQNAKAITITGDAGIIFPLIIAGTEELHK